MEQFVQLHNRKTFAFFCFASNKIGTVRVLFVIVDLFDEILHIIIL